MMEDTRRALSGRANARKNVYALCCVHQISCGFNNLGGSWKTLSAAAWGQDGRASYVMQLAGGPRIHFTRRRQYSSQLLYFPLSQQPISYFLCILWIVPKDTFKQLK